MNSSVTTKKVITILIRMTLNATPSTLALLARIDKLGVTRIILQTHHIDENPSNCDASNLLVLCQFCHGANHGAVKAAHKN
jgi:hypothetical protein